MCYWWDFSLVATFFLLSSETSIRKENSAPCEWLWYLEHVLKVLIYLCYSVKKVLSSIIRFWQHKASRCDLQPASFYDTDIVKGERTQESCNKPDTSHQEIFDEHKILFKPPDLYLIWMMMVSDLGSPDEHPTASMTCFLTLLPP